MMSDARIIVGDLELPGRDNVVLFKTARDTLERGRMGDPSQARFLGALRPVMEAYGLANADDLPAALRSDVCMRDVKVAFVAGGERITVDAEAAHYRCTNLSGGAVQYMLSVSAKRGARAVRETEP
jgi:hypothetical protein